MGGGWKNIIKDLEFYVIQIFNLFKARKYKIGFVVNNFLSPYSTVMASTRIRVYDVIKMFQVNKDFLVGFYNPFKKYNVVIFQKKFDERAFNTAKKLKKRNMRIILDINVNYYDTSSKLITKKQNKDIIKFTKLADGIIVPTNFLAEFVKNIFPEKKVWVIEESVENRFFEKRKERFINPLNLIWCGYSVKASEILLIEDILKDLYKKINFELILISEKDPKIKIGKIPAKFVKYSHSEIPDLLLKGDIFIAPRDLNESYNLSHSFTKIGVAMAVGLPVIASPVPSYLNSPVILCSNKEEWERNLEKMLNNVAFLKCLSNKGREFVKENYSLRVTKTKYEMLFNELLK